MDDLISKEKVIDILDYWYDKDSDGYVQACKSISELPTEQPKTGHWWARNTYPQECECWDCSECKETVFEQTNYCPNCGAKIVEL